MVRRDYVEGKIDLASPVLVIYEVFNALRYHVGLSPSDMARYLDSLLDMQMDLRLPSEETNRVAAKLAFKEGISGYDAHYVALAQSVRAQLLTSDAKLRDKLSDETRKNVKLLREYV
jgi:predicted nucleic acid-binding protein